jgi:hypothetical protein
MTDLNQSTVENQKKGILIVEPELIGDYSGSSIGYFF